MTAPKECYNSNHNYHMTHQPADLIYSQDGFSGKAAWQWIARMGHQSTAHAVSVQLDFSSKDLINVLDCYSHRDYLIDSHDSS